LIVAPWPGAAEFERDEAAEAEFERIRDTVAAIRNIRSEMNVPPSAEVSVTVLTEDPALDAAVTSASSTVRALARVSALSVGPTVEKPKGAASGVVRGGTVFVPLAGLIDVDVERKRLAKENDRLTSLIAGARKKLENESFVQRAKPEVVQLERDKLESLVADLAKVSAALAGLSS
jgi:valyl-tRNA synthetase